MQILKEFIRLKILAKLSLVVSALSAGQAPANLEALPYNTAYDLKIPTPERSGQGVHPDIQRNPSQGPRFLLAFTPYPFSMDKFENPSILVSDDGLSFREERKGINPLVPAPAYDHNDDPDLFFSNGKWHMLYLETLRPERQNLVLLESSDRIRWSSRTVYSADLSATDSLFMLSPAVIETQGRTLIFFVSRTSPVNIVQYAEGNEDGTFRLNDRQDVLMDLKGLNPWHVDIFEASGRYYMLICTVTSLEGKDKQYSLHIAQSADLRSWTLSETTVLENSYRASGFVQDKDLYVYYSRQQGFLSPWHIGIYRTRLADYFGDYACASR